MFKVSNKHSQRCCSSASLLNLNRYLLKVTLQNTCTFPGNILMFKGNNRNTRKKCELCLVVLLSLLLIARNVYLFLVFLLFLLLILNRYKFAGIIQFTEKTPCDSNLDVAKTKRKEKQVQNFVTPICNL